MTAQAPSALRAVIFQDSRATTSGQTLKLLNELGHDVHSTATADEALAVLSETSTDLVVIDALPGHEKRRLVTEIGCLPADKRPRQIAIFCDRIDDYLSDLRRQLAPQVHVMLKPLHLHGLLSLVKSIERASA
jgi:DNA-binding response OmpR family regulator